MNKDSSFIHSKKIYICVFLSLWCFGKWRLAPVNDCHRVGDVFFEICHIKEIWTCLTLTKKNKSPGIEKTFSITLYPIIQTEFWRKTTALFFIYDCFELCKVQSQLDQSGQANCFLHPHLKPIQPNQVLDNCFSIYLNIYTYILLYIYSIYLYLLIYHYVVVWCWKNIVNREKKYSQF